MAWSFRRSLLLGPAALAALLGFGCSSSPSATASTSLGATSEALGRGCPSGSVATNCCGPEDGCNVPVCDCVAIPACKTNPSCAAQPKTTDGYDPLLFDVEPANSTFADRLKEAGCSPAETIYAIAGGFSFDSGSLWGTASCPASAGADLTTIASGVLPCDSCTGDPGKGRVIVAWLIKATPRTYCANCPFPGTGCDAFSCLQDAQLGAITAKAPAPPPIIPPPPHL
jgi:hypothetical protein